MDNTNNNGTLVRTDIYATNDGVATGAITYWSLSGRIDIQTLDNALAALPEGPKPIPPSDDVLLRRAVRAATSGTRGVFCDQHPSGGWLVVGRAWADGDPSDKLRYAGELHVQIEDGNLQFSDVDHPLAEAINHEYHERIGRYDHNEISSWLIALTAHCHAVGLRSHGGFYFVPQSGLETYRAAAAALRTCSSHTLFEIPAMSSRDTTTAIIAALQAECDTLVAKVEEYCAKEGNRRRGYEGRLRELADMSAKLEAYADFMDAGLDRIVATVNAAQVTVTQGLLDVGA